MFSIVQRLSWLIFFIKFCRCCVKTWFHFPYICWLFTRSVRLLCVRIYIYIFFCCNPINNRRLLPWDRRSIWVPGGRFSVLGRLTSQLSIGSTIYMHTYTNIDQYYIGLASTVECSCARELSFDFSYWRYPNKHTANMPVHLHPSHPCCTHMYLHTKFYVVCIVRPMQWMNALRVSSWVPFYRNRSSFVPLLLLWRRMKHSLGLIQCCTHVHLFIHEFSILSFLKKMYVDLLVALCFIIQFLTFNIVFVLQRCCCFWLCFNLFILNSNDFHRLFYQLLHFNTRSSSPVSI